MPATVGSRIRRFGPGRAPLRTDRTTITRIGIVASTALVAGLAIVAFGRPYHFGDLGIYHGAVAWWWSGGDLYTFIQPGTTLGFTYPPFAALVMVPMAPLPTTLAGWINTLVSLAVLTAVLAAVLVPVADRCGWSRWFTVATAVPLAVALEPVRETLGFGQVNLLLFGLVLADMVALRWRTRAAAGRPVYSGSSGVLRFAAGGMWAGAGIGLATAVKITPGLFIVYLLVTRQWRAAGTAALTAIGATTLGFLVAGQESMAYFTSELWQTDRVGDAAAPANQSLAGLLARFYDSIQTPGLMWLAFSMVVLAVGLNRASNAHADGDELAAFSVVGLTANVISPISWTHHLVFVVPALVVLFDATVRRRRASRGLAARGASARVAAAQGMALGPNTGIRTPIWFPALTGARHAIGGLAVYLTFLVAPTWPRLVAHLWDSWFAAAVTRTLAQNALAITLIVLVAALPWRPGAEPVFYPEPAVRPGARHPARGDAVRGS